MTALRDIVVVLDDSASSAMRLTVAVDLAQQHGAHLTGFSAEVFIETLTRLGRLLEFL